MFVGKLAGEVKLGDMQMRGGFQKVKNLYESEFRIVPRKNLEESGVSKKDYIILRHINPIYEVFKKG